MFPIQMVDLQSQYKRYKQEIDSAIENVLLSGAFIKGPEVGTFEHELKSYTGAGYVTGCANGTDALQIAFMALDLPEGSEIITPAFSYAAVAEVLHMMRLKPVYVEVDPKTFLLDADKIEALLSPATRAIAPVHLYGQCCDMEKILKVAEKNKLYVVEDTAQAIGAVYHFSNGKKAQAGTMGHIGTTSFFPSKNLGCYGDGGAVFSNDEELAKKMKMIANHGQEVKYDHRVIGINSRLDTLQAAILSVKLKHLKEFESQRNGVADKYDAALSGCAEIAIPQRAVNSTHVFHQYTTRLKSKEIRDGLMAHLKQNGIPSMVYYPLPLYKQPAYHNALNMLLSESLCDTVLSLPIHTEMEDDQIEFISKNVLQYLNK